MEESDHEALGPLLEWLNRLRIISDDRKTIYSNEKASVFFDALKNGYILSKIAIIGVPHGANLYRNDVCPNALTR